MMMIHIQSTPTSLGLRRGYCILENINSEPKLLDSTELMPITPTSPLATGLPITVTLPLLLVDMLLYFRVPCLVVDSSNGSNSLIHLLHCWPLIRNEFHAVTCKFKQLHYHIIKFLA